MRLVVAAVGRLKAGPERELAERYRERASKLSRSLGFHPFDIAEIEESRARRPEDRIAQEGAGLSALISGDHVRVALDSRGQSLTSQALADRLARWRDDGRASAYFLIGGADGLAAGLQESAQLTLAFGTATWPHQLVRIMLLEQLYRAATILSGHPYHRAG
jgi:23S rRNA (pseudouridine1915-N3)-methyltransferase